jgi:Leucine-rich repeat (LRR) protein
LDFLVKQAEQGKAVPHDLALISLGALGSDAKPALEKLRSLAKDPSESFVREVNRTIDRIEKNDRILTHAEEAVKIAAARKAAREAIEKLQATQARLNAPRPKELEFLATYPKLKDLSLAMTEKEFLDIARNQKLKLHIDLGNEGSKYQLATGDGHTLIVMFRNYGEPCTGIQRIRGEQMKEPAKSENLASATSHRPNDLRVTGELRSVPLKLALQWLANAAALELQIDENDVRQYGLNLNQPVNSNIANESPREIFEKLIDWKNQNRIYHEIRGGRLIVTTSAGHSRSIRDQLPDWLKSQTGTFARGLGVQLDENNEIVSLNVSGTSITEEFLKRLTTLPKLAQLRISESHRWTSAALDQLANLPQLQTLEVSGIRYQGKGLGDEALKRLVKLKSLSELTMSGCGVTDLGVKELENLKSLRKLTIGSERLLTDAALVSIGRMTQLKSLDLESRIYAQSEEERRPSDFTEAGLRNLVGLKDLEELNLLGRPVTAAALDFPNLKSLKVGHFSADDACAAKIAQLQKLQSLVLTNPLMSAQGLKRIAELPNLTKLRLASWSMTDEGISQLQNLKKLQEIYLEGDKLTDLSLKNLSQIRSLNRIELRGIKDPFNDLQRTSSKAGFTSAGVQQLKILPELRTLSLTDIQSKEGFWGLKEFTQLKELILNTDSVSAEEIDVLEESLPNTRIRGNARAFSMRRRPG